MKDSVRVEMSIRIATKQDVLDANLNLKEGIWYYVKSIINPGTFCGPINTGKYTDKDEFKYWFRHKRIWVPEWPLDNRVHISPKLPTQKQVEIKI